MLTLDTPGIWSDEQVAGWKMVTSAVHAAGGRIFLQLWHVGRISDPNPNYLDGAQPVVPSAIAAEGHVSLMRPMKPLVRPRALELDEIPGIVEAFSKGTENAKAAGFDGVEVHGANGYLLDQFLQDSTNQRTDAYGGSIENRARLMLEVTDAAISVWGAGRVGVHIAQRGDFHSMGDSNPLATFTYLAREFAKRGIAFICVREHAGENRIGPQIKAAFGGVYGVYIANEQFTSASAEAALAAGEADAVAWGKLFIANLRIKLNAPLNAPDTATFYGGDIRGYTDYPTLITSNRNFLSSGFPLRGEAHTHGVRAEIGSLKLWLFAGFLRSKPLVMIGGLTRLRFYEGGRICYPFVPNRKSIGSLIPDAFQRPLHD